MESEQQRPNRKIVFLLAAVLLVLAVLLFFVLGRGNEPEDDTPKLAYAEGVTVVEDPDALQKAIDEAYAKAAEGGVALEYKGDASSEDGVNFICYIANAVRNKYDMYIQIFADSELTDQLYLSGLIRPGSAFDHLELEHPLGSGTNTVYCVFTQVEEDLETVHAQVVVTMNFSVA